MQDFLIGRQQIMDRDQNVFAYELLFRDSDGRAPQHTEATEASNQVIVNSILEAGLEHVVGSHRAFINFTRDNLLSGTALLLPKDKVVIEVLETVAIDDALVESVQKLAREGYWIALDDFVFSDAWLPLVRTAHIIKLDVQSLSTDTSRSYIKRFSKLPIKFLAEKVETQEQFLDYHAMGCAYFQGYYFSRPKIVQGKRMGASQHALLRLLVEINRSDIDVDSLAKIISTDAGLSYKLLRYINTSALFRLPKKVESISRAVFYLGLNETRRWANLMALAGFPDTPVEIIMLALARAKMCEQLAVSAKQRNSDQYFLAGMMSMLDKMMGVELAEAIDGLPLSEEVVAALLRGEGILGAGLDCASRFELWQVDKAHFQDLTIAQIGQAYLDAVVWANDITAELAGL
jgi:EAL and modified HD-GYP domain-containing signal transduction protein